jgi:large subunit ribosomal protein L10
LQKSEKERVVAELTERLRTSETLIVADFRGLTMTEIDALRTKLLESGARFSVVKNTLTRKAAEAAGVEPLLAMLEGPTAIAFLESDGDPVAVAKALGDTARTTRVLSVRGGMMQGRPITVADVEELAKLPPTDVLRGQVAGAILSPLYTIVGLFSAPLRDLVGLIDARIEQLGGEGQGQNGQVPVSDTASDTASDAASDTASDAEGSSEEATGGEVESESEQPESPAADPTASVADAVEAEGTTDTTDTQEEQ